MVTRLVNAPRIDFTSLRRELKLPTQFPLAAQREADKAALEKLASRDATDRTDIPFVTIDPPTSRDLDQAVCLSRRGSGFRVFYAIADVSRFVAVGGELEAETWRRGQTVYLPDAKVPLHPVSLSEGAASLLPGEAPSGRALDHRPRLRRRDPLGAGAACRGPQPRQARLPRRPGRR